MKMKKKKKVLKHLKKDIETFKHEAKEDRELIKDLKKKPKAKKKAAPKKKFKKVMKEFSEKELHSGSKTGPRVTNPKQAVAIAYSEQRKAGKSKKKGK